MTHSSERIVLKLEGLVLPKGPRSKRVCRVQSARKPVGLKGWEDRREQG